MIRSDHPGDESPLPRSKSLKHRATEDIEKDTGNAIFTSSIPLSVLGASVFLIQTQRRRLRVSSLESTSASNRP
jgi:hypothetical protein